MNKMPYNKWVNVEINNLLENVEKIPNKYDEQVIRKLLIFLNYDNEERISKFFHDRCNNEELFEILITILLDESEDYSNDARYSAARVIPYFDEIILKSHKRDLIYAQNYSIKNLHPFSNDNIPIYLNNDDN